MSFRVPGSNDLVAWKELSNQDANKLKSTHALVSGTWRYLRVRIGWLSSGSAGIYEWRIYQRINIIDSTFEPQGNEAVPYDGGAAAGNCTFSGNLIQGAGNDPAQQWGNGFEINGPSSFTVTNTIWQTRGTAFNLQRHVTDPSGWVITDNVLDASHTYQATAQVSASQQILTLNVYGGTFARNTIVSAAPGGSVAYLSGSHDMDWRTTAWRDAGGRSGYATPTQASCAGDRFSVAPPLTRCSRGPDAEGVRPSTVFGMRRGVPLRARGDGGRRRPRRRRGEIWWR